MFGAAPPTPHPAIVRVFASEPGGLAQGSGTLVRVYDQYAVVVTNWHVVRDAKGPITVVFPNGFQSAVRVLKVDPDWDLAALWIWRPGVDPIPISSTAPRPGEVLTIAGYGAGSYRTATGRCTQYVAPAVNLPYEMVEVSVQARQGDSGGPILNQRGELAGVLFGSNSGTTTGSYCGRVRSFLESAIPEPVETRNSRVPQLVDLTETRPWKAPPETSQPQQQVESSAGPREDTFAAQIESQTEVQPTAPRIDLSPPDKPSGWEQLVGKTPWEQGKSFLATVGILALLAQFLQRTHGAKKTR
jgi:S1-C subfamily serine protease